MIQKIPALVFFISTFSFCFFVADLNRTFAATNSCGRVLTYRIGSVDPRFGIDEDEALVYTKAAVDRWNAGLGKKVLQYDPKGKVVISFIFDERQSSTIEKNIIEEELRRKSDDINKKLQEIENKKISFLSIKTLFENEQKSLDDKVAAYNNRVAEVNGSGGADPSNFSTLEAQKVELQKSVSDMEARRVNVNSISDILNAEVIKYNSSVTSINTLTKQINQKTSKLFEQGVYTNNKIKIYQYSNPDILTRLLQHELGHALGLGHTKSEDSVMYYINKSTTTSLSQDDINEYKKICRIK